MTESFCGNFLRFSKSQTPPTKIALCTRASHIKMASFIVEAMVCGIKKLIRGHNFHWLRFAKTLKIKHLENRELYSNGINA